MRNTLAQIRSHLLFHAAALSYRGKGIILAADSGCGKTTLTLALVRQGFKFLSDDVAALNLNNGELAPYPRSLLIRIGTKRVFQQLGWELPHHDTVLKTDDRAAIHFPAALRGDNCQPQILIIIQRPDESGERICKVTLDSMPARLWAKLKHSIPDLISFNNLEARNEAQHLFKTKEIHLNKIYKACEHHGVLVLDVEETKVDPSYYENTPQLQKISKLTAALSLLSYFFCGYTSVLLQENYQDSAVNLIEPLLKILEPLRCYQLTPGRLDQTVEIINELC